MMQELELRAENWPEEIRSLGQPVKIKATGIVIGLSAGVVDITAFGGEPSWIRRERTATVLLKDVEVENG